MWDKLYFRIESEIPDFYAEGHWYGMMEVLKNIHLVYPKIRTPKNKANFVEGWFDGYRRYWKYTHQNARNHQRIMYPTLNLFKGIDPDYE